MPIATAFIRIFAALVLSIPLIFSFSYYVGATAAESTLLDADFVAGSFERSRVYDRVYGEVFLRQEFNEWTSGLIGNLEASSNEKVQLLRDVLPPDYIEGETERNVSELFAYLKGQDDELNVFINLNTPLENAKPTALAFLDRQIEGLDTVMVSTPAELSDQIASFLITVADGRIPPHLPSGDALDPDQRVRAYQQAMDTLAQDATISASALAGLKQQEPEALDAVERGDFRSALKLASRIVAEPRVDEAIAGIRRNSDEQDRLDLVEQLAENSDRTSGQVLRDAGIMRFLVRTAAGDVARWAALGVAVLCLLAIALLFIPYWKHVILWPSITVLAGGLLLLLMALATTLDSAFWAPVVCQGADPGSCQLILDIGREVALGVAGTFADVALKIIVIGLVGIMASLVVSRVLERRAS